MIVYIGTNTGKPAGAGIRVFRMESASGALVAVETADAGASAFHLALHPQRPLLFAVDAAEHHEGRIGGAVSAYTVDAASGRLTLLNRQFTHGTVPCYVSVDPTGRHALVANYGSGSVATFPVQADGRLGEMADLAQHAGTGPRQDRQDGPHTHYVAPDPTGGHVLACDLGIDQVLVYRLDPATGKLIPGDPPFAALAPGAGPRHLAFGPSGRFAYVAGELDSTLTACAYAAGSGTFQVVQSEPTLPSGFAGENYPAHVAMAPSGRFIYLSNRGHDSIAIFAVDEASGRLAAAGHAATGGRWPWHFAADPNGRFLLVANQRSNDVTALRIAQDGGVLQKIEHVAEVPAPVCVLFGRS